MELPPLIAQFVDAQNAYNAEAYTACFTESAMVHDEGKTHTGKQEIREWIAEANKKYQSVMKPVEYEQSATNVKLTAEVSGTFPGSPIVLKFHLGLKGNLIESLKVTG
jgi:ketosteroid isomerase-like protein